MTHAEDEYAQADVLVGDQPMSDWARDGLLKVTRPRSGPYPTGPGQLYMSGRLEVCSKLLSAVENDLEIECVLQVSSSAGTCNENASRVGS